LLNPDPDILPNTDPDQDFFKTNKKKFDKKKSDTSSLTPTKDFPASGEASSSTENSSSMNFSNFFLFLGTI
jgi:adenine-specific DNA methylase